MLFNSDVTDNKNNAPFTSERTLGKQWMRLLGNAIKEAVMFIELYGKQQLEKCWSLLRQEIAVQE